MLGPTIPFDGQSRVVQDLKKRAAHTKKYIQPFSTVPRGKLVLLGERLNV